VREEWYLEEGIGTGKARGGNERRELRLARKYWYSENGVMTPRKICPSALKQS
jgi:hypothetical protein